MSIFKKIVNEIKEAASERVSSEAIRLHTEQCARDKFKVDFVSVWKSIAKPTFDAFVSDAKAHGYDAKLVEHPVSTSKYGGTVFLMPVIGRTLSNDTRTYFRLSGEPFDQIVELVTSFDLANPSQHHLEFIRRDRLEAALEAFLRSALQSVPSVDKRQPAIQTVLLNEVVPPILR